MSKRRSSYCDECGKALDTGYSCTRCTDKIVRFKINKNTISFYDRKDFNIKTGVNQTGFNNKRSYKDD